MKSTRILIVGPDHEPLWVRLYVWPIGERWAAMIVADGVELPEPRELKAPTQPGPAGAITEETGFSGSVRLVP